LAFKLPEEEVEIHAILDGHLAGGEVNGQMYVAHYFNERGGSETQNSDKS
jgi:hypothetical protein